jgi:CheY-like chemotaxis protein
MTTLLQSVGFEVRSVTNGLDAVQVWRDWQPHLIWMDMRMPVMDGYEAIQLIKSSPQGDAVVIVGLTASAFEEDRVRVIQQGADDFVRKPFKASDIFDVVQRHLGVRYVYASQGPAPAPAIFNDICPTDGPLAELMASMPADILRRLREATELSDIAMIDQVITEIRTDNETLADSLTELAENFAYDKILNLVEFKT